MLMSYANTVQHCVVCFALCATFRISDLMAHSYRLGLITWVYQAGILVEPDICHRGRAYALIQCSKLFKGLECTVLSMVLCTIKNT